MRAAGGASGARRLSPVGDGRSVGGEAPPTAFARRLVLLLALTTLSLAAPTPPFELHLAVVGLSQDYLEPCGCGGQNAGGLARRTALLTELRRQVRDLRVIDIGGFGVQVPRLPTIVRTSAAYGADVCGLSGDDLAEWDILAPVTAASALAVTSLVPPAPPVSRPAPPASHLLDVPGGRVGVVSMAYQALSLRQMIELAAAELKRLREVEHCRLTLLVSHLGLASSERLLAAIPVADRPAAVLLATAYNDSQPYFDQAGTTWIPVAQRGRSLSVVTIKPGPHGWDVDSDQRMVLAGPRDARVQAWVDEVFRREVTGEKLTTATATAPPFPPVAACAACHAASVTAWRATAHARAVETLEKAQRDVAACLVCHSETFRQTGLRPAAGGDRGVECATCHTRLADHLKDPQVRPPTATQADCERCHTTENSPHWRFAAYRDKIVAACRGQLTGER